MSQNLMLEEKKACCPVENAFLEQIWPKSTLNLSKKHFLPKAMSIIN